MVLIKGYFVLNKLNAVLIEDVKQIKGGINYRRGRKKSLY